MISLLLQQSCAGAGSALIRVVPVPTDPAADPWFHTRPSASAADAFCESDPSTSGGSNPGGFPDKLLAQVQERPTLLAAREGLDPALVPADAVTASVSRVDPHISPAYALLQVARMARVTGLPETEVRPLVAKASQGRASGFFGQPTVNDPALRLAVAAAQHRAGGTGR